MHCLLFAILLALNLGSTAFATPLSGLLQGRTDQLTRAYNIELRPDRGGSCERNKWWPKVQKAYTEALEAVDEARQALEDLKAPMPQTKDIRRQDEWKRKAQMFYALFGKNIDKGDGLGETGKWVERTSGGPYG